MSSINMRGLHRKVAEAHSRIEVGKTYFLSNFYDKEGATVRVVSKSNKTRNKAGFFSIVNVEILDSNYHYYKVGEMHTVNAANLYERREDASPAKRFGKGV